jgi:NAD(P)-dependent dehydrogenase (short-subunit alcohol dehydrogenase family)
LISGGTSGIGIDLARAFAALSAWAIATGTSKAKLEKERGAFDNVGIELLELDVRDKDAVEKLINGLNRLAVLVNCAGISHGSAELDDLEKFEDVIDVNPVGMMRLSKSAHRAFLNR